MSYKTTIYKNKIQIWQMAMKFWVWSQNFKNKIEIKVEIFTIRIKFLRIKTILKCKCWRKRYNSKNNVALTFFYNFSLETCPSVNI